MRNRFMKLHIGGFPPYLKTNHSSQSPGTSVCGLGITNAIPMVAIPVMVRFDPNPRPAID